METTRWTNPSQPQTLQSAVILLYINAVLGFLFNLGGGGIGLLLAIGGVAGGWGIANEKKWGYQLGVAVAVLPFLLLVPYLDVVFDNFLRFVIAYAFKIVLVALLLHQQSREYQKIWFR